MTLDFALEEDFATVTATCAYAPKAGTSGSALVLDGRESFVELLEVAVDGAALSRAAYTLTPNAEDTRMTVSPEHLGVSKGTEPFTVTVTTRFKPQDNLELSGLYKSGGNFCTQCEAEGFRLITYFPDRPDVMSTYETRVTADLARYPVLLSNGNLKEQFEFEVLVENAGDSSVKSVKKHTAVWHDPHKKPCYLFALVAGDLAVVEDSFVTMSGRDVTLRIYAEKKNIDRCDFAMRSLIKAMRWDETRFGLEYDLDLFNIVAVDDFNMGAMENKSLNIFNSRLVLATPSSATDGAFGRIEGVIGHEYFHNWTGNRVTCRDWFQLSLKEGLTVFRDQEFSADVSSRAVKRIGDVRFLRDAQFAEDASPMAHPIRPSSYMKIDNFYTLTVYEKGAEVIRLYHTLLGERGFRKGMDLYFERHDGNAVTCDDFFAAMRDANEEVDIEALHNWYHQAGTPVVRCERKFDTVNGTYVLTFEQHLPTTPDERGSGSSSSTSKRAQIVPVAVGLLDPDTGADLRLRDFEITVVDGSEVGKVGSGSRVSFTSDASDDTKAEETVLLVLSATKASFAFAARPGRDPFAAGEPNPSLLRGFSAPVRLTVDPPFTTAESVFQFAHDPDPFNRWEAAQTMARGIACRAARSAASAVAVSTSEKDGDQNAIGYDGENLDFVAFVTSDEAWPAFADACASILDDAAQNRVDRAWVEEALSFPATSTLVRELAPFNPIVAHKARRALATAFATRCAPALKRALAVCDAEAAAMHAAGEAYDISAEQVARRSLSAYCLQALAALDPSEFSRSEFGWDAAESARAAFDGARNMTETVAALGALSRGCTASSDTTTSSAMATASDTTRHYAFGGFLETWKDDANVSCTYLGLVAGLSASASPGVAAAAAKSGEKNVALANVRAICENLDDEFHGVYDAKVPNKFYALIGGFARGNVLGFHASDGGGYDFVVAKLLEMDAINAIAASRLAKPFTEWRLYDPRRASLMRACLEKILAAKPSPNMFEICTKSLAAE